MTTKAVPIIMLAVTGCVSSVIGVMVMTGSIINVPPAAGGFIAAAGIAAIAGGIILFRRKTDPGRTGAREGAARIQTARCRNCGNVFPVHADIPRCPFCGSDLKAQQTLLAGGDMKRSMDDRNSGAS